MNAKLDMLEETLAMDSQELVGHASKLLRIPFQINRLEAFRNQTMHLAKRAAATSRQKLTRLFERLSQLIVDFGSYLIDLARNILPFVRARYPDVAVTLVMIAEFDGREDEKVGPHHPSREKAAKMDAASKFKSMRANARIIKHYRCKITITISDTILATSDARFEQYQRDPGAFLDSIRGYDMYAFHVKERHKSLDRSLQRLVASEPEVSIHLHTWLKEYKKSMKELDVSLEFVDPPLLNGEEQGLIRPPQAHFPKARQAEYCLALANDQIKSADNTETLLIKLEPFVSEKYRVPINEKLNDAIDGNLDVARKCIQTFVDIISHNLKPATKQLFQAAWYGGIIEQIVVTMKDYTSDQPLVKSLLSDLLVEHLEAFLVRYLTALANSPKLCLPAATDRIKAAISAAFIYFTEFKPDKELEKYFEVIEHILAMLEASKSMAFLSFLAFAKVHGPCIPFLEGLMKARAYFD